MRVRFEKSLIRGDPVLKEEDRLEEIAFHTNEITMNESIRFIKKEIDKIEAASFHSLLVAASKCRPLSYHVLARLWDASPKTPLQKFENSRFTEYLCMKEIITPENLMFKIETKETAIEMERVYDDASPEGIINRGDLPRFEFLMQKDSANDKRVSFNGSKIEMLSLVAYVGNIEMAKIMEKRGINFTEETARYAVMGGSQEMCDYCYEKDCPFKGCLQIAIEYHQNHIAKWLLKTFGYQKVDLTFCVNKYNTLAFLFFAANGGDIEEADKNGVPPLVYTGKNANLPIVKYLLENGADIEAKDSRGKTCATYAAENGNIEILDYLNEMGANLSTCDVEKKQPIHWAAQYGQLECVAYLAKKGVNVNAQDDYGKTPLIYSVPLGNMRIINYLIKKGADINIKDATGVNAITHAAHYNNIELVKLFVSKGANIEDQSLTGWNPLLRACYDGFENIVTYLVEIGANIEVRAKDGYTPLMYAALNGSLNISKFLIKNGADTKVVNSAGQTILDVCTNSKINQYIIEPFFVNYDC